MSAAPVVVDDALLLDWLVGDLDTGATTPSPPRRHGGSDRPGRYCVAVTGR